MKKKVFTSLPSCTENYGRTEQSRKLTFKWNCNMVNAKHKNHFVILSAQENYVPLVDIGIRCKTRSNTYYTVRPTHRTRRLLSRRTQTYELI